MDTGRYVEQLTAPGRGAVAVIRLRSTDIDALNERFVSATGISPSTASIGRILFGKWGEEDIVVVRTADDEWEINCHGGDAAVSQIRKDLNPTPEQTQQSLHEAITSVLLQCRSRKTANYVLVQLEGTLREFLSQLNTCQTVAEAARRVDQFLAWQSFATHLTQPWKMAIVGQPNAGKSSLLNSLIGYERAIVFDQPGTTRDRIEAELIVDGWPVQAVDTAGIRETSDDIETTGVAAARTLITDCDICLLVVDSFVGWTPQDSEILDAIAADTPSAILLNKSDLVDAVAAPALSDSVPVFHVSATTGRGLAELLEWIPAALMQSIPDLSEALPVLPQLTTALLEFQQSKDLQKLKIAIDEWLAE